jgi:hypothetical protein
LLQRDGQRRVETKGNNVISIWYKQCSRLPAGLPTVSRTAISLQQLQNIQLALGSTQNCPLLPRATLSAQSATRLICKQFATVPQAVTVLLNTTRVQHVYNTYGESSPYCWNVSHSANTHSYAIKHLTMTYQHSTALSIYIPVLVTYFSSPYMTSRLEKQIRLLFIVVRHRHCDD